jgi:formylglycine-generating enzyme required for sulfatase activity
MSDPLRCASCGCVLLNQEESPFPDVCTNCGSAREPTTSQHQETAVYRGRASQAPAAFAAPMVVEGYQLLGILGRGGMGVVYRARQLRLNREVALKVLPPALAADPGRLDRFRHEAALAATLNDSHILPVHDVLDSPSGPILVMPLIDGSTLARVIEEEGDGRPRPEHVERVLPVLDQVVDAVAVLDRANILHRDIKPSNILIDRQGHVWLGDFGLARLGRESQGTVPGTPLGTPGYMSPEQMNGSSDLDGRTDVFGVGVTIYHALTGRLPYGKALMSKDTLLAAAPSTYQPLLSRDMEVVILKALEPDRDRRYASPTELRDDWRRVRQGLPPCARRVTALARFGRWVRCHRLQAASVVVICLLVGVVAAMTVMTVRASRAPDDGRVRHEVRLRTSPAGAEVVLVPVNEYGELQPEQRIRPRGRTPLLVPRVPAGEYLVVVNVPDHGFHEVYRVVPGSNQAAGFYPHNKWEKAPDGTIDLPAIDVPRTADVRENMVRVEGGSFRMGSDGRHGKSWVRTPVGPAHDRTLQAFDLDATEVTVKDYVGQGKELPPRMKAHYPKEPANFKRFAVTHVLWAQARAVAEQMGKRLPTEEEYECAATARGTRDYPWSNDEEKAREVIWKAGPVGEPAFDCVILPGGKIFGLYSNVAEWTESRFIMYTPQHHPSRLRTFVGGDSYYATWHMARSVRGAPFTEVLQGQFTAAQRDQELVHGPRGRFQVDVDSRLPLLGFRCARSARPRFLE